MASSVAEVLLRIKAQGYETLDAVARDLADVEEQARRVERAQDDLGDSAGRVGSGAAKLAGALSLVGPAGGEAARTLADLADVVEVGAEAVGALQVSWAGLATAGAALGLALSPLILLWRDYAASQEQATAAAEAWARVQDASLPLVDRALTSVQALNIEVGGLTDAEKEQARIALEWDAALAQANETVREELNLARERLAQLGPSKAGYEDARRAVADLERQLTENADAAAKGMRADQLLAEVRRETAEANRTLEERERSLKAARADATSTTEDLAAQEATDLEAIVAGLEGWSASMGLLGSETVMASQEVDAAVGDIKAALGEVEGAADAAGAAIARMSADAQGVNAGALLGNLGGAAQTFSTGSVGAMAEAWGPAIGTAIAGPVGAAVGEGVGQLLSGLEALGAAGGAEGVQAKLDESLTNIAAGIEALPTLVADVLPDLVTQLVANIVPALLELQARLFVELQLLPFRFVAGFIEGFDQWWSSVGGLQGLATAVWDGLTGWFSEAWATVRDFFRELFGFSDKDKDGKRGAREVADSIGDFGRNALDYILTGSYATGVESVPRTGVYKLHAGERVVPAHLREAGGGEGGSVHLHIQGFSIGTPDQLVRELNRALGDNGRRLAWRT